MLRADSFARDDDGRALASKIIRAALKHNGDLLAALRDIFCWMSVCIEKEQQKFTAQIEDLVWASAELGAFAGIVEIERVATGHHNGTIKNHRREVLKYRVWHT